MKPGIYFEVHRSRIGASLTIMELDEDGGGHGYRIAGPDLTGTTQQLVMRHRIGARDVDEICRMLNRIENGPDLEPSSTLGRTD